MWSAELGTDTVSRYSISMLLKSIGIAIADAITVLYRKYSDTPILSENCIEIPRYFRYFYQKYKRYSDTFRELYRLLSDTLILSRFLPVTLRYCDTCKVIVPARLRYFDTFTCIHCDTTILCINTGIGGIPILYFLAVHLYTKSRRYY